MIVAVMKKSKANANNPTESKAKPDDCSVASSLSSIPLKDLKKHLAQQQQQQQQQQSKNRNNHTNKPNSNKRKKPGIPKKTATTNGTTDRAIHTSKTRGPKCVSKPKIPNLTKNGNGAHPPASTSFTTATSGSILSSTHSDPPLAMACCLCHCGLDCADRTLFFPTDRLQEQQPNDIDHDNEDDNIIEFTVDDPYIPIQAHDPHNALVYCDGCSRLYHQKCHFVPLLIIPRGKWFCLLCTTSTSIKPPTITTMSITEIPTTSTNAWNPDLFFQSPPIFSARIWEQQWERQTGKVKAKLWNQQLAQTRQFCKTQASNIRLASTQLETMCSISRNRQHLLAALSKTYYTHNKVNNRQNQRLSSSSQQLADTLLKLTSSQWKLRTVLMSLEQYQRRGNHVLTTSVLNWAQQQEQAPLSVSNDNVVNNTHHSTSKVMAYLFPHGLRVYLEHGRTIPRTAEWKGYHNDNGDDANDVPMGPTTTTTTTVARTSKVPLEISIFDPPSSSTVPLPTAPSSPPRSNRPLQRQQQQSPHQQPTDKKKIAVQPNNSDNKTENDNDSGISLDDLQCCICRVGDATDENDLLLCDGEGCCRAFHMACVWPALTLDDVQDHEDEDWFCPLCQAIPNLLVELQEACMDEEWVYRKAASQHQSKDDDDDDDASRSSSLQSWNCATDVFPESEWQMQASKLLRLGPQHQKQQGHEEHTTKDSIARLLGTFLGPDFVPMTATRPNNEQSLLPIGSDSEDENDYSLFDEASFEERKRQKRATKPNNDDDDDGDDDDDDDSSRNDHDSGKDDEDSSTRSSQVTLQEMSSVELEIDDDELAALSDGGRGGSSSSGDDHGHSVSSTSSTLRNRRRASKRLRNKVAGSSVHSGGGGDGGSSSRDNDEVNLADFDPANIVVGKRRRTSVDYRKLNDALFGELTAVEQAKLDDQLDYEDHSRRVTKKRTTKTTTTTKKKRRSDHPNGRRVQSTPAGRRKNVTTPRRTHDRNSSEDEEEDDGEDDDDDDNDKSLD